ncbi:DUF4900 domain-containing protein [Deinococcus sp. YIM 77859]|uniref:DUF4900 domain-containing protein n=1 Tax=Deinococcus sp. YIM 77859 TaxID=1540221 RepID=UPI00054F7DF6|nr:DUF4900 domain-containing protein [Deinococcus sp. YIM 77859]
MALNTRHEQGMALVSALFLIVLVLGVVAVTTQLTVGNLRQTGDTVATAQTLALAQGGRNFAQSLLRGPVGTKLSDTVTDLAQRNVLGNAGTWVFSKGENSPSPDPQRVAQNMQTLAAQLQNSLPGGGCYGPFTVEGGQTLSVRVTFTGALPACDGAVAETVSIGVGRFISGSRNSTQTYSLPYVTVIAASKGAARRTLTVSGEYQFDVGNGSFARFALLTDIHQQSDRAAQIYFTSDTLFNGPVHTNGNFAFYGQPWFGGAVSSSGVTDTGQRGAWFQRTDGCGGRRQPACTAFRDVADLSPTPAYGNAVPTFTSGVDWEADEIELPNNSNDQKGAAERAGILINGDATVTLSVGTAGTEIPGKNGKKYQAITVNGTEYRAFEDSTFYMKSGNTWRVARNASGQEITAFNGVIYASGRITRLAAPARTNANDPKTAPPALAAFSEITVAAADDIRIASDLKYEDDPCDGDLRRGEDGQVIVPNCETDPLVKRNVLGIYSSGGDVLIGLGNTGGSLNVPRDVRIHATLMASVGQVRVENYATADCNGKVYILGGVIEKTYGPFGRFNSGTGQCTSGMQRSFTYDQRMLNGLAPPYFPTTQMTSLLPSRRIIQYGQAEQERR